MVETGFTVGFEKASSYVFTDSALTELGKSKGSLYYLTEDKELQIVEE